MVARDQGGEESGCGYKRAAWGVLVVMEMFCILMVSMSMSWLGNCTIVFQDVPIGWSLGKSTWGSPYSFLKLHVVISNNYLKYIISKSLILRKCGQAEVVSPRNQREYFLDLFVPLKEISRDSLHCCPPVVVKLGSLEPLGSQWVPQWLPARWCWAGASINSPKIPTWTRKKSTLIC